PLRASWVWNGTSGAGSSPGRNNSPSVDGASSPRPVADVIRTAGVDTSKARVNVLSGCPAVVTIARRKYLPGGSARTCSTRVNTARPSPAARGGTSAVSIAGSFSVAATSYLTFTAFDSGPYASR